MFKPNSHSAACFAFSCLLVALILAASWAPESQMTKLGWVPKWAGMLADLSPNIRTAVPFIPLAFVLVLAFARRGFKWAVAGSVLICCVCVAVSECGQVFLPNRTADLKDLMWGGVGTVMGAGFGWVWKYQRGRNEVVG